MAQSNTKEAQWADITNRAGIPEVETDWVADHFDEVRVIDVRERDELEGSLGHIAGIEHVPLGDVWEASKKWNLGDKIVVLCRSGGRSGRAARSLETNGFTRVASMAGGMLKWNDEGRPVVRNL
ncbi:rhodanese-like domain-containing protein [Persicimonas caeni]|uniref:Rhodanese-like domain-containing protein n=1 Tax=Persicimonas caeni TaxID=2292766 RepID=A0A4Y6PQT3_PERCE|nr:rhodanese-like domain-containing protein [Persicimonas caeni]QDG50610.1 rhodanese-like domain-containing protein [Persicimonas caeni]QED31831.1 rhodanese-like domain-containing protein [Persicimonas caeni]